MLYGPIHGQTHSPLVHDSSGVPVWSWDHGLPAGALPTMPSVRVEMDLPGGGTAVAVFPSKTVQVLVDHQDRERVELHWSPLVLPASMGRRKKIAGCHLFVELRSDGLIVLEAVVSNGQVDPAVHHSHLGAVRHSSVDVVLPDTTWAIAGNPSLAPIGDWYLPSRAWTSRRMVMYRPALTGSKGAAEALLRRDELRLPGATSIASPDRIQYERTARAPNQPLHAAPVQGLLAYDRNDAPAGSMPKGAPDAPAGFRIEPMRAWEANEGAAIQAAIDTPRLLAGHPVATFDVYTGEPVWPERWPQRGEYHLTGQRIRFDPWVTPSSNTLVTEFGWATNASPREANPGPCSNRQLALNYTYPYDSAHMCRILGGLYSAWALTRSWAAWLGIRAIACDVMTSWTLYGRPWDQYHKAWSLQYALMNARQYPGKGNDGYLREQAWVFSAIASAVSITKPGPELDRYLGTREAIMEYINLICLPSGIARDGHGSSDNGVPWSAFGMPIQYGAAATFQVGLWIAGLHQLLVSGPRTQDSSGLVSRILAALKNLYDNPSMHLNRGSPPYYLGTSYNGVPEVPLKFGVGRAHDSVIHGWDSLARAFILTGNYSYIDWMTRLADPPLTGGLAELQARWAAQYDCWRVLANKVT